MPLARLTIKIHGAVQGVGFRPFVFRLAEDLGLAGWVLNDSRGVFVEAEGERERLERFLTRLPDEKPPLAAIHSLDHAWLAPAGYREFTIRHSEGAGAKTALVLPDVATCPECLAEVLDDGDRRRGYAFANCTNCGPRFTIVEALPYDRPNTTMRGFALCPACRAEYEDPRDRRFHAQPTACPVCGPSLELLEEERAEGEGQAGERSTLCPLTSAIGDEALLAAAQRIRAGQIVAVKGLGGFHLMCDARSDAAVALLRERKVRREKPLAVMARDLEMARELCAVTEADEALLTSPAAPIVLMEKRLLSADNAGCADRRKSLSAQPALSADDQPRVAESVAPGNPRLGVMLPSTPLHHLLLRDLGFPVVATSANLSDEPICTDEHEAAARLGGIADAILAHNRPIARHADDSIAAVLDGEPRILRRARGYAPLPVLLRGEAPCVLAVGAHLKNTVALSVGRQVFISQHIGDLETPEALGAFERVVADFLRLYEARPAAIAHDLHPDYASTTFARHAADDPAALTLSAIGYRLSAIPIQHHHGHFASVLAENQCEGEALGVVWDGTGLGTDGTIWGGEFLVGDVGESRRAAHLLPFRLPGGDAAAREGRRAALALLWELLGPAALEQDDLAPVAAFTTAERRVLGQMLARGSGSPVTTSAGRLFDGVAALIGLRLRSSFEGQAAMQLEWICDLAVADHYPYEVAQRIEGKPGFPTPLLVDWRPTLEAILDDLRRRVGAGVIAARFHNTMVEAIGRVAGDVGIGRVALSGGCFQNRLLTERAAARLRRAGFEVLLHRQVPPNDGGISLGQAACAAARLRKEQ